MSTLEVERKGRYEARAVLANGVTLRLAIADGLYQGFTAEREKQALVVAGRGNLPYFVTPDGIHYTLFPLRDLREEGDRLIVELDAIGQCAPVAQDIDMYYFPCLSRKFGQVRDALTITFEPHTVEVAGESYQGFSVSYAFHSDTRKIHWLLESLALAPGGGLCNARVMSQHLTTNLCRLEEVVSKDSYYNTEENYGSTCIQAPCRGGGSEIYNLAQGAGQAVATYFAAPGSLKSAMDTQPGEDFLTVADFHYQPLSGDFVTQPRIVVGADIPRDSTRAQEINRWTAWFDFTGGLWQQQAGIARTATLPVLGLDGTGGGGTDPGFTYAELLEVWAERMEWVEAQGFKAIVLHTPEWISAAHRRTGMVGGNNCCPFEFKLSEYLGGDEGMQRFCDTAHAHGVKVYLWIGGHLAQEAPIWRKHPEWKAQNPAARSPEVIVPFSMVHGGREWMRDDLRHVREATGADGVWFDSFTSQCLQTVNYQSPYREPNAPDVIGLLGDLSAMGYEIMLECTSQLGVTSYGNLGPTALQGQEELLYNTSLRTYLREWPSLPEYNEAYYYRSLAARAPIGVWLVEFNNNRADFPPPLPAWFAPLTNAYAQVAPRMATRELLAQGEGALWYDADGKPAAYFPFQDGPAPVDGLVDVVGGEPSAEVTFGRIYAVNL